MQVPEELAWLVMVRVVQEELELLAEHHWEDLLGDF